MTSEGCNVHLECEDGSKFVFPRQDIVMLPIVHATTEELAIYIWGQILHDLDASMLLKRGIHTMEVTVGEAPGQEATFRMEIPDSSSLEVKENEVTAIDSLSTPVLRELEGGKFDIKNYIMNSSLAPKGCNFVNGVDSINDKWNKKIEEKEEEGLDCSCKNCPAHFLKKLEILANAINAGQLQPDKTTSNQITIADLQDVLKRNEINS